METDYRWNGSVGSIGSTVIPKNPLLKGLSKAVAKPPWRPIGSMLEDQSTITPTHQIRNIPIAQRIAAKGNNHDPKSNPSLATNKAFVTGPEGSPTRPFKNQAGHVSTGLTIGVNNNNKGDEGADQKE